jgi:hypothetical protein
LRLHALYLLTVVELLEVVDVHDMFISSRESTCDEFGLRGGTLGGDVDIFL